MDFNKALSVVIRAKDYASPVFKTVGQNMGTLAGSASSLTSRIFSAATSLRSLAVAGVAGVGIGRLGGAFLSAASDMESYILQFETLTGSAKAAGEMIEWLKDVAIKSPFQMPELVRATIMLQSVGVDAKAAMKTVGDTAAAIGRGVEEVATALISMEREVLRRFGIVVDREGDKAIFKWADTQGKIRQIVSKNTDFIVRQQLLAIWQDRYEGGMVRFQKSWKGLTSTMADNFRFFMISVMESGPFDYLKRQLNSLVEAWDRGLSTGKIQRWAESVAQSIMSVGIKVLEVTKIVGEALQKIYHLVQSFPSTAEMGLIGLALFGRGKVAAILAALGLVTDAVDKLLKKGEQGSPLEIPAVKVPEAASYEQYRQMREEYRKGTSWSDRLVEDFKTFFTTPLKAIKGRQEILPVEVIPQIQFKGNWRENPLELYFPQMPGLPSEGPVLYPEVAQLSKELPTFSGFMDTAIAQLKTAREHAGGAAQAVTEFAGAVQATNSALGAQEGTLQASQASLSNYVRDLRAQKQAQTMGLAEEMTYWQKRLAAITGWGDEEVKARKEIWGKIVDLEVSMQKEATERVLYLLGQQRQRREDVYTGMLQDVKDFTDKMRIVGGTMPGQPLRAERPWAEQMLGQIQPAVPQPAQTLLQQELPEPIDYGKLAGYTSSVWQKGIYGIQDALQDFQRGSYTVFSSVRDYATGAIENVREAFSSTFEDLLTGQANFSDVVTRTWRNMRDNFRHIAADLLSDWVMILGKWLVEFAAKKAAELWTHITTERAKTASTLHESAIRQRTLAREGTTTGGGTTSGDGGEGGGKKKGFWGWVKDIGSFLGNVSIIYSFIKDLKGGSGGGSGGGWLDKLTGGLGVVNAVRGLWNDVKGFADKIGKDSLKGYGSKILDGVKALGGYILAGAKWLGSSLTGLGAIAGSIYTLYSFTKSGGWGKLWKGLKSVTVDWNRRPERPANMAYGTATYEKTPQEFALRPFPEEKHQGGLIEPFPLFTLPKFHTGGLAPDERLIVAQTGEGVLSRQGMATLGRPALDALNRGQGQTVVVQHPSAQSAQPQQTIEHHYHINYVSQNWDERDARRAFEDDFLPMLMEASSRLKVVEDNGIKVTAGR